MKMKIEIKMDNAAFDEPGEITRILRKIADNSEAGIIQSNIFDINGNCVGHCSIIRTRIRREKNR